MRKSKFDPKFPGMLVKHMRDGYSFESFGGRDDVLAGKATLYLWIKSFPEFKEAYEIGKSIGLLQAEIMLESAIADKRSDIDKQLLMFKLKTRFHTIYGDHIRHMFDDDDQDDLEFI